MALKTPLPALVLTAIGRALVSVVAALLLAVIALRWLPPPTTSFMLQSPVKPVRYAWVPRTHIAKALEQAVVASEDQKFRQHHGFDVEAMQQAYENNRKAHHRRRGASTISQQMAKNLFLWPDGGYLRKGIEALLTMLIEFAWGKDRILEVYLNVAEFGPGIYGAEAASQAFFGKPAARLTPQEAARLAAVLPNPRHWSVRNPGPYVESRAAWIMGQMGYGRPLEEPELPPTILTGEDAALPAPVAPAAESATPAGAHDGLPAVPEPPAEPAPDAAPEAAPAPTSP